MVLKRSQSSREESDQSPTALVLDAIAEFEETTPMELAQPLFTAIDPDALDRLFRGRKTTGTIAFEHLDYQIHVSTDDTVRIEPRA